MASSDDTVGKKCPTCGTTVWEQIGAIVGYSSFDLDSSSWLYERFDAEQLAKLEQALDSLMFHCSECHSRFRLDTGRDQETAVTVANRIVSYVAKPV